jgi:hypothetical protein
MTETPRVRESTKVDQAYLEAIFVEPTDKASSMEPALLPHEILVEVGRVSVVELKNQHEIIYSLRSRVTGVQ